MRSDPAMLVSLCASQAEDGRLGRWTSNDNCWWEPAVILLLPSCGSAPCFLDIERVQHAPGRYVRFSAGHRLCACCPCSQLIVVLVLLFCGHGWVVEPLAWQAYGACHVSCIIYVGFEMVCGSAYFLLVERLFG
jgi:hypothetical protein